MNWDPNKQYKCPDCNELLTPSNGLADDGLPIKLWCMPELKGFDPRTENLPEAETLTSFEDVPGGIIEATPATVETIDDGTAIKEEAEAQTTAESAPATENAAVLNTIESDPISVPITKEQTTDFQLDPVLLDKSKAPALLKDKTEKLLARCEIAFTIHDKVLLYGPPGTGKSTMAAVLALRGRELSAITLTPETPMFELRGGDAIKQGTMFWRDGVLTRAIRHGHRCILDEVDHAGPDAVSFMHAALDDRHAFMAKGYTLPSGETIFPHEHYQIVCTMNGMPKHLSPAIKSRLAVAIHVDQPFPAVLQAVHPDMRTAALNCIINGKTGSREWIRITTAFEILVNEYGWDINSALTEAMGQVFGESAGDYMGDIKLAAAPKASS